MTCHGIVPHARQHPERDYFQGRYCPKFEGGTHKTKWRLWDDLIEAFFHRQGRFARRLRCLDCPRCRETTFQDCQGGYVILHAYIHMYIAHMYGSHFTVLKIHSSLEIEDFVETHVCKLCVILRSRAFLCVLIKDTGRRLPLELQQCSLYQSHRVMFISLCTETIKNSPITIEATAVTFGKRGVRANPDPCIEPFFRFSTNESSTWNGDVYIQQYYVI